MCRTISNYKALQAIEENGMVDVFIVDDMTRDEENTYVSRHPYIINSLLDSRTNLQKAYHYILPAELYLAIISRYTYNERYQRFNRHKEPAHDLIEHWMTHTLIPSDLFLQPYSFWQELYAVMDPAERTRAVGIAREHFRRSLGTAKRTDWIHPEYDYDPNDLKVDMDNDVAALAMYYRLIPMWIGDIMGYIPMWMQAEATYRRWKL